MSILNPSVGELVDRKTILELKIVNLKQADAPFARLVLQQELDGVRLRLRELRNLWLPLGDAHLNRRLELAQVNENLWNLENRIRRLGWWRVIATARTARAIHQMNDVRARLVAELSGVGSRDAMSGIKIYR